MSRRESKVGLGLENFFVSGFILSRSACLSTKANSKRVLLLPIQQVLFPTASARSISALFVEICSMSLETMRR